MIKLKKREYKVLFELIKNCKNSDRKIAKIIGISQPTVTRIRNKLEQKEILSYTAILNFEKLGFKLMAFIFGHWKHELIANQHSSKVKAFLSKNPNIIFWATGRGMLRADRIAISLHNDYSDFVIFIQNFEKEWGKYLDSIHSFTVSFKGNRVFQSLTLKHLPEYIKNNILEI